MSADISTMTLAAAAEGLASKQFSSVELTQSVIDAIAAKDGEVGAYISFDAEGALGAARAADARLAAGERTPLLGVPIAVKDNFNVVGQPCTCASKILEGYTAQFDATVIAKLKALGAVCAGRTNMDEMAMGVTTESSAFKVTKNPLDLSRVPGGSSGGSAAAVAGGMALAALGSDTAGSVRQPAAFCGCVGLKPSYGLVSRFGMASLASSLDVAGTLTKNVEDAAILLDAIAGRDENDHTMPDVTVPNYRALLEGDRTALEGERTASRPFQGLRIGVPGEYFTDDVDAEVAAKVREAIARCEAAGAVVREVSLPHTKYAVAVYQICSTAEASANLARFDGVRYGARRGAPEGGVNEMYDRTRTEGFGDGVKRRLLFGTFALTKDNYENLYVRAMKARTLVRKDFENVFAECDVLATPTCPVTAFGLGKKWDDPIKAFMVDAFTLPVNLAGNCAISVPCGTDSDGMPAGLQFIGPAFGEAAILRAAMGYEAVR